MPAMSGALWDQAQWDSFLAGDPEEAKRELARREQKKAEDSKATLESENDAG